jgi:pimeloyl-ACP methyl ester carboxylesterase
MSGNDKFAGGSGGIKAHYDDMEALAKVFAEAAGAVADTAIDVLRIATSDDLLASAVLSPGSFKQVMEQLAEVEARLAARGLELEKLSLSLRAAVVAYKAVDEILSSALTGLENSVGFELGLALPLAALPAAVLLLGVEAVRDLPTFIDDLIHGRASLSDFPGRVLDTTVKDANGFVLAHPGLVQDLIGGAAGLESGIGVWALPLTGGVPIYGASPQNYHEALQNLAGFFRDGDPIVGPGGHTQPGDDKAPNSVSDLLMGVDRRQRRGPRRAVSGEIGIQRLTGADGLVRYVVQLPGTESWKMPGAKVRDLSTNLHTMAGGSTVYMRGIEQAMAKAHIPSGAPVMLVGHSQGGMTAAALAADPVFRHSYNVTQVVTAGAPIARSVIPPGIQVFAMENRYDIVPQLDGAPNPDQPNLTTVTFDAQNGTVGNNHSLPETYVRAARNLPKGDPSYIAWLQTAHGFLDPTADPALPPTRSPADRRHEAPDYPRTTHRHTGNQLCSPTGF